METKNIYQKMQEIKGKLIEANLKKSGENKYAGYKYYELGDFLPTIAKLCEEIGLFTQVDFNFKEDEATLTIVNCDKPEEMLTYHSPTRALELKGCNAIQALGGVETYSRRYLYMNAFDITENDMFDSMQSEEKEPTKEDAEKYVLTFGKHKGKKISELDSGYINWLLNNSEDKYVLKCIELVTGKIKPTEEEADETIELLGKLEKLMLETNVDREKFYETYKVESNLDMSVNQLKNAISILEKRVQHVD